MSAAPAPTSPNRLDSWKEIAEYVGRDVRTAIRWERNRGLPVHRVPGGRRGAVFAYRAEIDEWLRGAAVDAEAGAEAAAVPAEPGPTPPAAGASPDARSPSRSRRRAARIAAAVAAAAILVLAGLATRWRSPSSPDVGSKRVPAKLDYGAIEIVARAADGAALWQFRPPLAIDTPVLDGLTSWYDVADIDGDGSPEVLASLPLTPGGARPGETQASDVLFCFGSDGRVRWQAHLDDVVNFRAGEFGPPWLAGRIAAFRAASGWHVVWTQAHHTWWPGLAVVFDASGRRISTFTHAGQIRALRAVEVDGRALVLLGGVANAYRAAFVAVLDGDSLGGQGPVPAGSPFECTQCAGSPPLRYFVFPPSDINQATGMPYNTTARILSFPPAFEVFTAESNGAQSPLAEMNFRFSKAFELLDARAGDSFPAHEFYERAGKLDHPASRCPWYLKPPPVREWTPGGWRDLAPAASR